MIHCLRNGRQWTVPVYTTRTQSKYDPRGNRRDDGILWAACPRCLGWESGEVATGIYGPSWTWTGSFPAGLHGMPGDDRHVIGPRRLDTADALGQSKATRVRCDAVGGDGVTP